MNTQQKHPSAIEALHVRLSDLRDEVSNARSDLGDASGIIDEEKDTASSAEENAKDTIRDAVSAMEDIEFYDASELARAAKEVEEVDERLNDIESTLTEIMRDIEKIEPVVVESDESETRDALLRVLHGYALKIAEQMTWARRATEDVIESIRLELHFDVDNNVRVAQRFHARINALQGASSAICDELDALCQARDATPESAAFERMGDKLAGQPVVRVAATIGEIEHALQRDPQSEQYAPDEPNDDPIR